MAHNLFVIAGHNTKLVFPCGSNRVKKNSVLSFYTKIIVISKKKKRSSPEISLRFATFGTKIKIIATESFKERRLCTPDVCSYGRQAVYFELCLTPHYFAPKATGCAPLYYTNLIKT